MPSPRRNLALEPTDEEERYADDFAMALLMPEAAVREIVKKDRATIAEVAEVFGVEEVIAARRLRGLGLIPSRPDLAAAARSRLRGLRG